MSVQNLIGIHPKSCGGILPWIKVVRSAHSFELSMKPSKVGCDHYHFKHTLPDFVMTPKIPQFSCRVSKTPAVGFWDLGHSNWIRQCTLMQEETTLPRSSFEIRHRLNFLTQVCSFHHEVFHCFKLTIRKKDSSQKRPYLAGFREVITSRALECNIIQNIHPLHAVWRREQIRLKALTQALRGTHTKNIGPHTRLWLFLNSFLSTGKKQKLLGLDTDTLYVNTIRLRPGLLCLQSLIRLRVTAVYVKLWIQQHFKAKVKNKILKYVSVLLEGLD